MKSSQASRSGSQFEPNHESPRCGETFVTRKITRRFAKLALGIERCLFLGNMDSLRDWGHARRHGLLKSHGHHVTVAKE